ncbi:hypothetical protein MRX96_047047 [Rhipicephalus microplus]
MPAPVPRLTDVLGRSRSIETSPPPTPERVLLLPPEEPHERCRTRPRLETAPTPRSQPKVPGRGRAGGAINHPTAANQSGRPTRLARRPPGTLRLAAASSERTGQDRQGRVKRLRHVLDLMGQQRKTSQPRPVIDGALPSRRCHSIYKDLSKTVMLTGRVEM